MRTSCRFHTVLFVLCSTLGCGEYEVGGDPGTVEVTSELQTDNGLTSINGLTSTNGLSSFNGLSTMNGLSSTTGLMTTADGRTTVAYLVRCALPATASIVKQDQYGNSYTFKGEMGLAPQWHAAACDNNCQQLMSACMLAHVNTAGLHVPLWIVGQPAVVGWGLDGAYPYEEGAFFGDIFVSPPKAYYCYGFGAFTSPVPGRIGSAQTNPPYVNAYPLTGGFCATIPHCMAAEKPYQTSGWRSCSSAYGNFEPLTVWRAPWTH